MSTNSTIRAAQKDLDEAAILIASAAVHLDNLMHRKTQDVRKLQRRVKMMSKDLKPQEDNG